MKLDDVSWHLRSHEEYVGEFEAKGLQDEDAIRRRVEMLAAAHMGMFLTWCVDRDLIGAELGRDLADELRAVKERRSAGAEVILDRMDGKLDVRDLNAEAGRFAAVGYQDYLGAWSDLMNEVWSREGCIENSWPNYERVQGWLDARYQAWRKASG